MTHTQPQGWLQTLLPMAVVLIVVTLRARRMTRPRPLRIERLWVVPALYLVLIGALFIFQPPTPQGWGTAALGLLVGTTLGWLRGQAMRIEVDPDTHALTQRGSPMAFLLLAGLIALRQLARVEGRSFGVDIQLMTDGFMGLALGLLAATRAEMYLRARRLLAGLR